MKFAIEFHTPFRVASGHAGDGADTTVDPASPLPASSLKGVMRSAARDLLELAEPWVNAVFGVAWQPSPWSWSDAKPIRAELPAPIRVRARIQIADESFTTRKGALAIAEEVMAHRAEFTVIRTGWITPDLRTAHETILLASARAVTAIGGDRRRGLGWVSVTPVDPAWRPDTPMSTYVDPLLKALSELPQSPEPQ